ncbi:hypothetical protein [Novosphingobium resinovorum]|uniref:hypothetical protein n=1 Tax=Novosphingobium resinovorum TaxID=158500 RepID=UPI002ED4CFA2|nr:hypothetical protein [Novosphingobium resinovorum]
MTRPIIERAARALAQSASGHDDWDALDSQHQEAIIRDVLAVLHAIREPSDAMSRAGAEVIRNLAVSDTAAGYQGDAASTWRFMVAAAMNER